MIGRTYGAQQSSSMSITTATAMYACKLGCEGIVSKRDLLLKFQGRKWTSKATTMIPISAPAIATINRLLPDEWQDRVSGETLKSCTMIINEPNHDRMPVLRVNSSLAPSQPWVKLICLMTTPP